MSSIFVKHFELPCVERCYINKLALPCLAYSKCLAKPLCSYIEHAAIVMFLSYHFLRGTLGLHECVNSKWCLLEDAIWTCVDFNHIWTGGEHCEDAVGFFCHVCWRVYYLKIGVKIAQNIRSTTQYSLTNWMCWSSYLWEALGP